MTAGPTELLILRLGLLSVIFLFVAVMALSMRSGLVLRARQSPAAAGNSTGRAFLVVLNAGETGLARGARFELAGRMLIGRDTGAGIVLPDPSVSGRHASIEQTSAGWRLTDLRSTNGTHVRGRPVDARGTVLRGGDQIAFGNVVVQFSTR